MPLHASSRNGRTNSHGRPRPPAGRAATRPRALDGRTALIRLFDAYAALLTPRQRILLRLYYHDDLSMGEIASRTRVSRQAVHDSLRRSAAELRRLEARLGMLAAGERAARSREATRTRLAAVEREAAGLVSSGVDLGPLRRALRALRETL